MRLKRWLGLTFIVLYWIPSTWCNGAVWALAVWDAYIEQEYAYDSSGNHILDEDGGWVLLPATHTAGWHFLPPTQSQVEIGNGKPDETNCAIGWEFPVAVDLNGDRLPDVCQPTGFRTSDGSWEGI